MITEPLAMWIVTAIVGAALWIQAPARAADVPWHKEVADAIDRAEQRIGDWRKEHKTKGGADPATNAVYSFKGRIEDEMRSHLMYLWYLTGDPTIIPEIDQRELLGRSDEILAAYRKLLKERAGDTLEQSVRRSLPATIRAMDTPYACSAVEVMKRLVRFDFDEAHPKLVSTAATLAPSVASPAQREWYGAVWRRWYRDHVEELTWRRRSFHRRDGGLFDALPEPPATDPTDVERGRK